MTFEKDKYDGICAVCGLAQCFERTDVRIRETYRCGACKALLREREQAKCIVDTFGQPPLTNLSELAETNEFKKLCIYEPGTSGPFRKIFRPLANYQQSDFYSEEQRKGASKQIPHQDLEQLTYADNTFDLVLTSDILEHVRHPLDAFRQIWRVLKPHGFHIFTIPLTVPMPTKTVARVDTTGPTDKHLLPERYHGNGKGGRSLVYNDFGADIVTLLETVGFDVQLVRPKTPSKHTNSVVTLVTKRR